MSVVFVPYAAPDTSGQLWLWPEVCRQDPDRFTLELCNGNAADVLDQLGFSGEAWLDEPLRIEEFSRLVTYALRRRLGRRSPALPPQQLSLNGEGMRITDCGRAEGYIEQRLYDLARMAARAREIGATHIGWS